MKLAVNYARITENNNDRVALVTGAACGLGQGFAVRLASEGYHVVAVDHVPCEETSALVAQLGGRLTWALIDLADFRSIDDGIYEVLAEVGAVDVLVNNACRVPSIAFEHIDYAVWRRLMAINLDAPYLLCRALIPGMIKKGRGRIINIVSNSIGLTTPGLVHYVTSKSGMVGLTRSLASEYGDRGITVNAVAPGRTRMVGPNKRAAPCQMAGDEEVEFRAPRQAIPRGGEVGDLLGVVSFLASDDAEFMTGQTLVVDGGQWCV